MDQTLRRATIIARGVTGSAARVDRVTGGRVNEVFRVTDSANQPLVAVRVFQHHGYPSLDSLLHVDRELEQLGVRQPRLIAYERASTDFPCGWVAVEWLRGVRCDIALQRRLLSPVEFAGQLGAILAITHARRYDSFGALPNGTCPTARAYLSRLLERSPMPALLSERSIRGLDIICEWTATLPAMAAVLTHGDLTLTNAIWSNGQVTLIDWDNAAAGPSARDAGNGVRGLGIEADRAFRTSHGRCCDGELDVPVHEVLLLTDLLRSACAKQSTARDRDHVEQQVTRTISALRRAGR